MVKKTVFFLVFVLIFGIVILNGQQGAKQIGSWHSMNLVRDDETWSIHKGDFSKDEDNTSVEVSMRPDKKRVTITLERLLVNSNDRVRQIIVIVPIGTNSEYFEVTRSWEWQTGQATLPATAANLKLTEKLRSNQSVWTTYKFWENGPDLVPVFLEQFLELPDKFRPYINKVVGWSSYNDGDSRILRHDMDKNRDVIIEEAGNVVTITARDRSEMHNYISQRIKFELTNGVWNASKPQWEYTSYGAMKRSSTKISSGSLWFITENNYPYRSNQMKRWKEDLWGSKRDGFEYKPTGPDLLSPIIPYFATLPEQIQKVLAPLNTKN